MSGKKSRCALGDELHVETTMLGKRKRGGFSVKVVLGKAARIFQISRNGKKFENSVEVQKFKQTVNKNHSFLSWKLVRRAIFEAFSKLGL